MANNTKRQHLETKSHARPARTRTSPYDQPLKGGGYSSSVKSILGYPGAAHALEELCRFGVNRREFLTRLIAAADWICPMKTGRQPWWEIPGLNRRRLRKLAERTVDLADELEKIDAHQFIKSSYGLLPPEYEESFKGLPKLLRERAKILDVQIRVGGRTYLTIERGITKRVKLALIGYVRQSSERGRPMYREVASLLTAALSAVGRDEIIAAESLRTLQFEDSLHT